MSRREWVRTDRRILRDAKTSDEISVAVDNITLPSGRTFEYVHVISPYEVVFVVALDTDQNVCMLRQFRYLVGEDVWEVPAGSPEKGESLEQGARRELAEEAGIQAETLEHLASFYSSVGITNQKNHIFLATQLESTNAHRDESEVMEVHWLPFSAALDLVFNNQVQNVGAAYGILLARKRLASN